MALRCGFAAAQAGMFCAWLLALHSSSALDNGVALTPPMGW
jgi:hypothetical protein